MNQIFRNFKFILNIIISLSLAFAPYYGYAQSTPDNPNQPSQSSVNPEDQSEGLVLEKVLEQDPLLRMFILSAFDTEEREETFKTLLDNIDILKAPEGDEEKENLLLQMLEGVSEEETEKIQLLQKQFLETLEDSSEEGLEKIKAAQKILIEMGEAVDQRRLPEYLNSHSELRHQFDTFGVQDQEVFVIDPAGNQEARIDFNDYQPESYPEVLQNIEVGFSKDGKLTFSGVVVSGNEEEKREKQIGLVHQFKNIDEADVIDWAYDKELLVINHKTRGFIIFHMVFARAILGEAPIPYIDIHHDLIIPDIMEKNTENFNENLLSEGFEAKELSLEFIDRSVAPPKNLLDSVSKNEDGKSFLQSGDLMITSSDGRDLIKILPRAYLYEELKREFKGLHYVTELVTALGDDQIYNYLKNGVSQSGMQGLNEYMSSLFNRDPILFLSRLKETLLQSIVFLEYKLHKSNGDTKDRFLLEKWNQDFQTISKKLAQAEKGALENGNGEGLTAREQKKKTGELLSSKEMAKYLFVSPEAKGWFDKRIEKHNNEGEKVRSYIFNKLKDWKKNPSNLVTAGVILVAGYLMLSNVWSSPKASDFNELNFTVYNLVVFGVALLSTVYVAAKGFIPILKGVEKGLSKFLPNSLIRRRINQTIEKWENQPTKARLSGAGFKIAAYFLLPVWTRIMKWVGQPHFIRALAQGLNPFKKIPAESPINPSDKDKRLGIHWSPQWSKKTQTEHHTLLNNAIESRDRIQVMSRILALNAFFKKPYKDTMVLQGLLSISPEEFGNLFEKGNINNLNKVIWVSDQLRKYIQKQDKIDATKSIVYSDPKIIEEYYAEANRLMDTDISDAQLRNYMRKNSVKEGFQSALLWNEEHADMLKRFIPEEEVYELFWIQLIMDHLSIVAIPLTNFTVRGTEHLLNVDRGISPYLGTLYSSKPHLHEGVVNVLAHIVISARGELQNLGPIESYRKKYEEFEKMYESIIPYEKNLGQKQGFWRHLGGYASYALTSWGDKIREGTPFEERIDAGHQLSKVMRLIYRFIQVSLIVGVGSRFLIADVPMIQAIIGALYFQFGALFVYAWPQLLQGFYTYTLGKKLTVNKELLKKIRVILHDMKHNLYTSSQDFKQDYIEVIKSITQFKSLTKKRRMYFSFLHPQVKDILKTKKLTPEDEKELEKFVENRSYDELMTDVEKISETLNNHAIVTKSESGSVIAALIGLGIFSNIAFVYLSVKSFADVNPMETALVGSAVLGFVLGFEWLTRQKFTERAPIKKVIEKVRKSRAVGKIKNSKLASQLSGKYKPVGVEEMSFDTDDMNKARIVQILKKNNIFTDEDLRKYSTQDLLNIPGLAENSVAIIIDALDRYDAYQIEKAQESLTRRLINKCQAVFGRS